MASLFITSCGVKAPPLKHPEIAIDSYVQEYTGTDEDIETEQSKETTESKK